MSTGKIGLNYISIVNVQPRDYVNKMIGMDNRAVTDNSLNSADFRNISKNDGYKVSRVIADREDEIRRENHQNYNTWDKVTTTNRIKAESERVVDINKINQSGMRKPSNVSYVKGTYTEDQTYVERNPRRGASLDILA